MGRYILSRLAQALVSVLVVSLVVFALGRLAGNPIELLLEMGASAEMRQRLIVELGLDRSYLDQYLRFAGALLRGDLGRSVVNREPVAGLIGRAFVNTIQLGAAAMVVAILIAVPIGVYAAAFRNSPLDRVARIFAILGQSAPPFWVGIILIMVFGVWLRWLPTSGMGTASHLVLPAFTLGWYIAAGIMRLTRTSMLEVLRADYVRLARAKGVPESKVIWKHGFKNAALPVLTFTAILFVALLSGTVVTETVFAWPGLGRLLVQSVQWRDYPVVEAVVLLLSVMYLAINLLVDILYAYLNPRIRYGSGT
jgi:peptide/nickel transport system permease protein